MLAYNQLLLFSLLIVCSGGVACLIGWQYPTVTISRINKHVYARFCVLDLSEFNLGDEAWDEEQEDDVLLRCHRAFFTSLVKGTDKT